MPTRCSCPPFPPCSFFLFDALSRPTFDVNTRNVTEADPKFLTSRLSYSQISVEIFYSSLREGKRDFYESFNIYISAMVHYPNSKDHRRSAVIDPKDRLNSNFEANDETHADPFSLSRSGGKRTWE